MKESTTHFGFKNILTSEKTKRVAEVFHSVASQYDLMNDLMSFGLHRLWKRLAAARMNIQPHHTVLDLAAGTGDLCLLYAKAMAKKKSSLLSQLDPSSPQGKLFLCDINASMLDIAARRLIDQGILHGIECIQADAERLPFQNNFFDSISIAFGLRNITDKDNALSEMFRVLKPSGRVVILEFSQPTQPWLKQIYDVYSFSMLPWLGKRVAKDEDSYRYLAESIRMHPPQEKLQTMMEAAGFSQVSFHNIQSGIVALHTGFKMT